MATYINYEPGMPTLTNSGKYAISKALSGGTSYEEKTLQSICEIWMEKLVNGTPPSDSLLPEMRDMIIRTLETMQRKA